MASTGRYSSRGIDSLVAYPKFRLLWLSNMFFFGGMWAQTLILGWLVYDLTNSSFLLATFAAIRLAPMLMGPLSGVLSDRFNRIRFIQIATAWAFVVVIALAAFTTAGLINYWGIVVGGLCIGLAQSPTQPSRSSLVLDFVGRRQLSNANALNSMALNMTQMIGPALGGLMIGALGAPAALWISAGWYLISLILLRPLHNSDQHRPQQHEPIIGSLLGGIRMVLINRPMATILVVTLIANVMLWPIYQTFMPVVAKDILGLNAGGLGMLVTCGGIGGLAGSVIIAWMGDFKNKGGVFLFGTALWGSVWVLFSLSRSWPLSYGLMVCIGLASAAFGVLQTTLMLMLAPPSAHGRALGILELAIGIQPLATIGLGVAVQALGLPHTILFAGLTLVIVVLALAARTPQLIRYG